ncbi:quinone oxidoreductase TQO [Paraconexibacter sp. AEG42_29]|uniref:Quinone oxidoreductase TQO n=1 Tax=Paraconexibacter sp. AEG42_29 TaxID=2997339 RepID=A0AAU7AXT8_9ACTN
MPSRDTRVDAALLIVRAVVGLAFLLHGLDKLGDLSGVEQNFDGLGIPVPELMAPFVALTETVGGALLIAGLLTPLAGLALGIDMIVAYATVHTGKGFFAGDGGYELVLLLGASSFALMIAGAGRFSVDAALKLPERVARTRERRGGFPRPSSNAA